MVEKKFLVKVPVEVGALASGAATQAYCRVALVLKIRIDVRTVAEILERCMAAGAKEPGRA